MKRLLPLISLITLAGTAACTSALVPGQQFSDGVHEFVLHAAQVIDRIGQDAPPDGQAYLVLKYGVKSLRSDADPRRSWTAQMKLESDDSVVDMIALDGLEDQMLETSLAPGASAGGYVAYVVPDEVGDFTLTVTLPVSGTQDAYSFRPADRRIGVNAQHVLTKLQQIERTRAIPVVGGLLNSLSRAPIRYLGTILVPEAEIATLLEETGGLPPDEQRAIVEAYLLSRGHGELE